MRLAVAMVLAIPALLHGQDTDDQEKKEKRAQLIIQALLHGPEQIADLPDAGS